MLGARRTLTAAAVIGCLTACGAAAGRPAADSASARPGDAFTGAISSASGQYVHKRGQLKIALAPAGSAATRPVRITLAGTTCGGGADCVRLTGALQGTIARRLGGIPDVGQRFAIAASGSVSPLGRVSVSGTANGTGNIAFGHESLTLRLSTAKGAVTLTAVSGRVPGFTSP
jgi:hypothetical protein